MLAIAEPHPRSKAERLYRPWWDGWVFVPHSQHFVLAYFRPVPSGLIFSNHPACAILTATP